MIFIYGLLFLYSFIYFRNLFFWLKILQIKDYRLDRLKEYFLSPIGIKTIFNKYNLIYLFYILLNIIFSVLFLFSKKIIYVNILFFILVISLGVFIFSEFLIILIKIIKNKIDKPIFTKKINIIIFLTFIISIFGFLLIFNFISIFFIFSVLFLNLLLIPIYIFLANLIFLPVDKYQKNKIIQKAKTKLSTNTKIHKIGITGSYGKSSVKELLYQLLNTNFKTIKTQENNNNEMGISQTILKNNFDLYQYFVCEMGAYKIGEIDLLGKIVNHKDSFLTGIGTQHIALFGNQENIIKGKSEIINSTLQNNGTLYLNFDNIYCQNLKLPKNLNIITYGVDNTNSQAYTKILKIDDGFTYFDFNYKNTLFNLKTNLIGKHNILNLTGVLAYLVNQNINLNSIQKNLLNLKLNENTSNLIDFGNHKLINDTYNLSQNGLLSGIDLLNSFNDKYKILVLDDIIELGKETKKIHNHIGQIISSSNIDYVFLIGKNYQKYIKECLKNKKILNSFGDLQKILNTHNSVVLFAGRQTKNYLNKLINFK